MTSDTAPKNIELVGDKVVYTTSNGYVLSFTIPQAKAWVGSKPKRKTDKWRQRVEDVLSESDEGLDQLHAVSNLHRASYKADAVITKCVEEYERTHPTTASESKPSREEIAKVLDYLKTNTVVNL